MLTRRTLRAGLIGTALAVLTLAGHTAGGGALDAVGVAIVGLLSVSLAAALSARAVSLPVLLAVLLAGQGFLHLIVSFSAGHAHGASSASGPAMVSAHVLAAVVAAIVITHADALAGRWQAFLASVIGAESPRVAAAPRATATRAIAGHDPRLTLGLLLHGVVRRGPPSSVVFA